MSVKLYWNKVCPFVQRSWIAALEKNANVEYVHIPLDNMPEWYIKEVNPRETVPALKLEDGTIVLESMFIAKYFDEHYEPKHSLTPGDNYVKHRVDFFVSQIGDLVGESYGLLSASKEEVPAKAAALLEIVQYVESILKEQSSGPFFLGTTFSLADIAIVPFLDRFRTLLPVYTGFDLFANAPRLKALHEAAILRPSVAATLQTPAYFIDAYKGYANGKAASPQTIKFFTNDACPYAERARIAFALKELNNVEKIAVSLPTPSWYKAINPRATVPTVQQPDGRYVHESQLIVNFLSQEYATSGTDIAKADPKDRAHGNLFVDVVGNFNSGMFKLWYGKPEDAVAAVEGPAKELEALLAKSNAAGPYLFASGISVYDIAIIPFLHRIDYSASLPSGINLLAPYSRLQKLLQAARGDSRIASALVSKDEFVKLILERQAAAAKKE